MDAASLLARRSELLEELDTINRALESLKDPTKPVLIATRRNLRNTWYPVEMVIYADRELTQAQSNREHGGYICSEDLARLRTERPENEDDAWWVEEE